MPSSWTKIPWSSLFVNCYAWCLDATKTKADLNLLTLSLWMTHSQHLQKIHLLISAQNIPGVPGEDYPIFVTPPETQFDCADQIEGR